MHIRKVSDIEHCFVSGDPHYSTLKTTAVAWWVNREFKKLLRWRRRERRKTVGFNEKNKCLHVRYKFWYISSPYSARKQCEMSKFKVLWRTWAHGFIHCHCIVRPHCTCWTNWNNRKVVEVTRFLVTRRFRHLKFPFTVLAQWRRQRKRNLKT